MFLHNLLNVLVRIANKMGLQKKMCRQGFGFHYRKFLALQYLPTTQYFVLTEFLNQIQRLTCLPEQQ
jgi:hypothetical protein